MKTRWGFFRLLVTALLQVLVLAGTVLAYDISGTVEYSGAKTGRVFITVPQTQNGTLGTSVVLDGSSTSVPYSIRGVPNGNYTLSAFLDPSGKGAQHASDPTASANVAINSNVAGMTITLTDPATPPSPDEALPVNVIVLHGSGADMITWSASSNHEGPVPADSYNLYWSTDPNVMGTYLTSGGSRTNIPANDDKNLFFKTGIAVTCFYVMKSVVNGTESTLDASAAATSVGAGSTVSGVVALNGGNPAGKQLLIVLGSNDGGPSNFAALTTSGTTQSFSISGVPDGDYWIYPVFDMNGNGLLDDGDIWPSDAAAGSAQVAGGDVDAGTISFASSNVNVSVTTNYWKNNGTSGYNLNFDLSGNMKTPVSVTFTGGTNLPAMAVDAGLSNGGGFNNWTNISWTPAVGDTYTFDVTYADNTTETVTGSVTGVLDGFPTPEEPLSAIPYGSGTPTFTWGEPESPPAGDYTYSLSVWGNNGNGWWSPENYLPGTQLSAEYNYDNSASQAALADGQTYWWRISVEDAYGNSASSEAGFTYAGAIAGTVTDDWDEGIQNVHVNVCQYNSVTGNCNWGFNGANTDENGNYTLVGLPAGEYKVRFNGSDAGYIGGWFNATTDENSAEPVSVSMGSETAYIDALLTQGGSISGTVTNAGTSGIQNVNVQVCRYDSVSGNCNWGFNGANTDASGSYTLGGLPAGDYKVQFNASGQGYVSEWYDDTADMNAAAPLTVGEGTTVTGIDAVLAQGGRITGTVTNGTTGIQNVNVQVCRYDSVSGNCNWGFSGSNTDASGNYTLGGLPAGQYKVQFNASNMGYINEWYNDTTDMNVAAPLPVTAGSTATGINAVLAQGGIISGRVTNGTSGLSNVWVSVYDSTSIGPIGPIGMANTDSNGYYTVRGLVTGTYKVFFDAGTIGYANRWYNNKADYSSATTVSVTGPSTTPLSDAVLIQAIYYTITTTVGANGWITPLGPIQVLNGDSQAFSVTPYPWYVIDSMGSTCGGSLNGTIFTTNAITQNCSVTATFKLVSYPLTVNSAGTGSGTVTGAGTYNHGEMPMLTAAANPNSTFGGWSGDCSGQELTVSVLMDGPETCTATFIAVAQPSLNILWRNISTGENYVWYMTGVTQTDGASLPTLPDLNWKIVGKGDFNGDGKPDLLWRNTATGENYVWYMDGVTQTDGASLPTLTDLSWNIAGVADFNGDGNPDILWRNTATGENYVWYMDGVTQMNGASLPTLPDLNWAIVGVADFDADGKPDLLWRNTATGENYVWYMDGVTQTNGASLLTLTDLNWTIAGVADFDAGGKPDILWRNTATGENYLWYMDGVTQTGGASLPTLTDLSWTIVGK